MPEGYFHKIVDRTLDDLLERLEVCHPQTAPAVSYALAMRASQAALEPGTAVR